MNEYLTLPVALCIVGAGCVIAWWIGCKGAEEKTASPAKEISMPPMSDEEIPLQNDCSNLVIDSVSQWSSGLTLAGLSLEEFLVVVYSGAAVGFIVIRGLIIIIRYITLCRLGLNPQEWDALIPELWPVTTNLGLGLIALLHIGVWTGISCCFKLVLHISSLFY